MVLMCLWRVGVGVGGKGQLLLREEWCSDVSAGVTNERMT